MTRDQFDALFPVRLPDAPAVVPIDYFQQRVRELTDDQLDIVFPRWRRVIDQIHQLPVAQESETAS